MCNSKQAWQALSLLLLSGPVLAVESRGFSPTGLSALGQVTFGLAVVLLLLFALAWLVRRGRLLPHYQMRDEFKVLAVLPLGQKERLILLKVGEDQLLLGATAEQIRLLHKLETPLDFSPAVKDGSRFATILRDWQKPTTSTSISQQDARPHD